MSTIQRTARQLIRTLLVSLCLSNGIGFAATTDAQASDRPTRFGIVWLLQGEATASGRHTPGGRILRPGDPVFVGDTVRTHTTAEVVLRTDDAGIVALRPGALFVVEQFSAEGKSTDRFSIRIVQGALRIISGWISRTNRAEHRVFTATATIGIRGTDHETYVMSADLALSLKQPQGTYDKVNRGGTLMDANGAKLEIDPGNVGFARAAPAFRLRGLLTLMLPVLLDSVPDFYVPGAFDAELDRLSQQLDHSVPKPPQGTADQPTAAKDQLAAVENATEAPSEPPSAPSESATPLLQLPGVVGTSCDANDVARRWLSVLDAAITERDATTIVHLFAPEVMLRATIRGASGGTSTVELGRDEFARSTVSALNGLSDYQQRRPSVEAEIVAGDKQACRQVRVRSIIIEQGRQAGLPYRFEALEEYVLERREGRWVAVRAGTTQR